MWHAIRCDRLEEYLFDEMELKYQAAVLAVRSAVHFVQSSQEAGRTVTTTIGEYVEAIFKSLDKLGRPHCNGIAFHDSMERHLTLQGLLGKEKYFNRPLPRVPVKARRTPLCLCIMQNCDLLVSGVSKANLIQLHLPLICLFTIQAIGLSKSFPLPRSCTWICRYALPKPSQTFGI